MTMKRRAQRSPETHQAHTSHIKPALARFVLSTEHGSDSIQPQTQLDWFQKSHILVKLTPSCSSHSQTLGHSVPETTNSCPLHPQSLLGSRRLLLQPHTAKTNKGAKSGIAQ